MSANRSVQAAQRRRAGPTDGAKPGPQPSINSAQAFANQARPGNGPPVPNGRLAGQQVAMQQQQMRKQAYNQGRTVEQDQGISSITKMTIPQAITLITLRLGALETKMNNGVSSLNDNGNNANIDVEVVESILNRLETLESKEPSNSNSNSTSNSDVTLLKQQFDTIKQTLVQVKSSNTNISKENAALRKQFDNIQSEIQTTKDMVTSLNKLVLENSDKIFKLSMGESLTKEEIEQTEGSNEIVSPNDTEIVGTDLKLIIEEELSATKEE